MAIKNKSGDKDPILNYIFIIKDNALIFNSIFSQLKVVIMKFIVTK